MAGGRQGPALPAAQAVLKLAELSVSVGETYDFEYESGAPAELRLVVSHPVGFAPEGRAPNIVVRRHPEMRMDFPVHVRRARSIACLLVVWRVRSGEPHTNNYVFGYEPDEVALLRPPMEQVCARILARNVGLSEARNACDQHVCINNDAWLALLSFRRQR